MLLHKLNLNHLSREVRRDLASPYELHSTLCRAFSTAEKKCQAGTFLWRLETSKNKNSHPILLVQSTVLPDWSRIELKDWFEEIPDKPLNLTSLLSLENIQKNQRFRFRLRANPSICRKGKRQGLFNLVDQEKWIASKGILHGFKLSELPSFAMEDRHDLDLMISEDQMLRGLQRSGHEIKIYSVLFDGILTVTDKDKFLSVIKSGIGHGKMMGLGLLSLAPIR